MRKKVDRQEIYREVLKGVAIKKIADRLGIKENYINSIIVDIISTKKPQYKNQFQRINQIENELFDRIAKDNKDPAIPNLTYIYTTFLIKQ